jgi:hypothetical protein
MATQVVFRSQRISRDKLSQAFKTPELLKAFENQSYDLTVTIPDALVGNTAAVEAAQATADAALSAAAIAQTTANTAQTTATSALSAANTAQATVNALALRDVPLALVDAPVISVNALQHNAFSVTLGGNRTLDAPTFLVDGALLSFALRQDATGGRTLAFDAIYNFGAAGAPVLSAAPDVVDYAFGYYDAASAQLLMVFRGGAVPASMAASFSAHNNSVAQAIPNATFTKLTFSTEDFDTGSAFAANAWTPPAGRPVMLTGVYTSAVSVAAAQMTVAVYKNGAEFKRGTEIAAQGAGATGSSVTCIDIPNGTDFYELWAFQGTGAAQNTNGAPNRTYFQGTTLTP